MKLSPGQHEWLARLAIVVSVILLILAAIGRIIGRILFVTGEQYILLTIVVMLFAIYFNMDRMRETKSTEASK